MIDEFHYRIDWRSAVAHPGSHPSGHWGGGQEFVGHGEFLACPDPRQIDLRASLRDPAERLLVRRFRQRSAVPVFVLADVSASMSFVGATEKMETVARFSAAAAQSAYRSGDPFGFLAADEVVRGDLYLPLRLHRAAAPGLYQALRAFRPSGGSASGLSQAFAHLGRRRALVFLLSDFHEPFSRLESLLASLARHDLVPVVIWDPAEYQSLPRFGLAEIVDPETGQRRRLFMRAALRDRIRRVFEERRIALGRLFSRSGRAPLFLDRGFDADVVTRYFYAGTAP